MRALRHPSIETPLETLTPLYDLVLVERTDDDVPRGLIKIPQSAKRPEQGLRTGRVVAVGRGDKFSPKALTASDVSGFYDHTRHPMHVKPGDIVVYPRVPANDVVLNGKPYTLIHEEAHVLCVLDPD